MNNSVKGIVEGNLSAISTTSAYSDNFILTISGVLNIYYDLTEEDCDLIIEKNILRQLQFARASVNVKTLKLINDKLLPTRQNLSIRVDLNGYGAFKNLDFLEHLPSLKNLSVDFFNANEVEKINNCLQLESLSIGTNRISIKPLLSQTSLKNLFIFERPKDLEIIGEMCWLEKLSFSMQSLKSLDFLCPLLNLKELHFLAGGTRNLLALPKIGKIENLSFLRVRELTIENLLPINQMKFLKRLSFESQPHLTGLNWLTDKTIKTDIIACKNFKLEK